MEKIIRSADSLRLTDKKPAVFWDEAYPIGNGSKGAMIFGGAEKEIICLNDDTLWSGYPMDRFKGDGKASLDRVKKLVREGKYAEADKEASERFACYASQSYMPLGDIVIEFTASSEKVSGYKRVLDLASAVCTSEYRRSGVRYKSVSFASHPANAIIYRIEATENGESAKVINASLKFCSKLLSRSYTKGNLLCLEGECPVTSGQNIDRTDRKTLYFDDPEKRGIRFMAMAEILTDGAISSRDDGINVGNAGYLEVRITDATSFNGYKKHPFTEGKDYRSECEKLKNSISGIDHSRLMQEHIKDYSKYFNRVAIDLGTSGKAGVSTKDRMLRYAQGEEDKALPALLFNFGRYLTIAASRKGSEAMNLQGIWNSHFMAPWHSNYTVNINTEMNYFPTLAVGLKEMYQPLLRLIEEVSEAGVETAKRQYGSDGWCCHHNTDLWRHTEPVSGQATWLFWNGVGGWFCHHLMEYYEYTLDKKFLKEKARPIMAGAAKFYLSQLETVNGYRVIYPATSPENRYLCEGGSSAVSETTEMSMAIVRELFGNYVKVCDILGERDEVLEQIKAELPLLMPTMIGSDGRILEWYGEHEEKEVHHRHVSHLYSLHPGHAITPEKTPKLAQACRKTLEVRGDEGTGWSLAWKSNFFARLRDGDHVLKLIKRQLWLQEPMDTVRMGGGGTYPNLFCAHPPFQIDGNFGALSGITEMFLQSETEAVHIIPALPSEFENVGVKGLKAKGNRTVTVKVRGGKLVYCKITGSAPERITVRGEDMTGKFIPVSDGIEYCG